METESTVSRKMVRRIVVEGTMRGPSGDVPVLATATEWNNGEGWDITVSDHPVLPIHDSEFDMLEMLVGAMKASGSASICSAIVTIIDAVSAKSSV